MDKLDNFYMQEALKLAQKAYDIGDVPIGCVIVKDNQIIGSGYNTRQINHDVTEHAEINAIRMANQRERSWHLDGATLYVTLEPCPMCAGAIINSRISRVVYAVEDEKAGVAGTLMNLLTDKRFNWQVKIQKGILATQSKNLLRDFFKDKR